MDKKEKTAEDKYLDKQANNLLNFIVAKTYARHSKLTEAEFIKEIGFDGSGKTEAEAIRMSIMNVLIESMNEMLKMKDTMKMTNALLKTYLIDEKITEDTKEGE